VIYINDFKTNELLEKAFFQQAPHFLRNEEFTGNVICTGKITDIYH